MPYESLKPVESDKKLTLLNFMTGLRAIGGVALGIGMARYNIDPLVVAGTAAGLGALDAESSVFKATYRFPRLQKALRIIPTKLGRIADPISDKIYAISIFAGGLVNGSIPMAHGIGILSTEVATAAVTGYAYAHGKETEVSGIGKLGMVARCGAIGFDLATAAAGPGELHNTLAYLGHGSAAAAVTLGAISCYKIFQQYRGYESGVGTN